MLKLTDEEQAWLDAYREALCIQHPGVVWEIIHLRFKSPQAEAR